MEEFMDVSRERISYTLIPKLVNIVRNHEIFSLFSSTQIQMWQLPVSRFSASELNLIDNTRTDGAVTLIASKKSLDKETPVQTEVTVHFSTGNPTETFIVLLSIIASRTVTLSVH